MNMFAPRALLFAFPVIASPGLLCQPVRRLPALAGTATFATPLLPVGKHSITAMYAAGPGTIEGSSPAVVHTVQTATAGGAPADAKKRKDP